MKTTTIPDAELKTMYINMFKDVSIRMDDVSENLNRS